MGSPWTYKGRCPTDSQTKALLNYPPPSLRSLGSTVSFPHKHRAVYRVKDSISQNWSPCTPRVRASCREVELRFDDGEGSVGEASEDVSVRASEAKPGPEALGVFCGGHTRGGIYVQSALRKWVASAGRRWKFERFFFIVSIDFSQQFKWSMRGVGTGVLRTQKTNAGGLEQDEGLCRLLRRSSRNGRQTIHREAQKYPHV